MEHDGFFDSPVEYIHGDLELRILEARRLPDLATDRLCSCVTAFDFCRSTTQHLYVTVCLGGATVARTSLIFNSENPVWNSHFKIPLAHPTSEIEFQVKDDHILGAGHIGVATVPTEIMSSGETIDDWFPITGPHGKPQKYDCALRLMMKFTQFDKKVEYKTSIPEDYSLSESYFPVRQGGSVTLYQDAHSAPVGMLPEIELQDGKLFRRDKCWEDICEAIMDAHHLVYIVGWSIKHKVKLMRESEQPISAAENMNLGELLKYKAREGVRVLLLLWGNTTSAGLMQTHDKETKNFFKHSSVTCVLSPRNASNKDGIFKKKEVRAVYTHHQKCVIVDTQDKSDKRKITTFIGGLDLCGGRYDTPEHRLFRDLDTVFEGDYHSSVFTSRTEGPREPWHDLHCKIEGPAAYDILTNFEQRWRKERKDNDLLHIDRVSWINSPSSTVTNDDPSLWVIDADEPENWNVQVHYNSFSPYF